MASALNIGHRHLLPIEPLLFVAAGGAAARFTGSRLRAGAAVALLAGCAASFALAPPRYLSYFNFLAGGSAGGWRHLVDSNIDRGQDLLRLKAWMRQNAVPVIHLAHFGTADPAALGIDHRKVIFVKDFHPDEPAAIPGGGD